MNEIQKAAALLGKKGGQAGTGSAKARASEDMRAAASQRWGTPEQRFWRKVVKQQGEGCWEWIGCITKTGYGNMTFQRKTWKSHRRSWIMHYGQIPEGLDVLHKCDNKVCVRPDHLFVGTAKDNALDASKKGKMHPGEKTAQSKLKEHQVLKIRERYLGGDTNLRMLGNDFGVHRKTVEDIIHRVTWKHI